MAILKYEEMTWTDFQHLDKNKSFILVPIAPLEEHGPHLPVGVDIFDSVYFCEKGAEIFTANHPEYTAVIYPPLGIGSDCFRFPGTMDIDQRAIYLLVKSMGKNLKRFGMKNVMFVGLHGGPRHISALEQACRALNRWHGMNALAPFGRILTQLYMNREFACIAEGKPLTDEEWYRFERDIHAGYLETSLTLLHHENLVRPYYKKAKDYPIKLVEMRRHPFGRFINWEGQIGYPSLASKEAGERIAGNMTKWFAEFIEKWIEKKENLKKYNRSLISKMLIFNVNFSRWAAFISALAAGGLIYWIAR